MLPTTARVIQKYLDSWNAHPKWDTLRTERAGTITQITLENVPGAILEIGAHKGGTTRIFCEVAQKHSRQVFVVDPWDGRQQGDDKVFQTFKGNTSSFTNLIIHRTGSESPAVRKSFIDAGVKFAFILIDGLHTKEAVRNDILNYVDLLNPNGVLCIDDWTGPYGFSQSIQESANEHLDDNMYALTTPATFIERYFVKLQ